MTTTCWNEIIELQRREWEARAAHASRRHMSAEERAANSRRALVETLRAHDLHLAATYLELMGNR